MQEKQTEIFVRSFPTFPISRGRTHRYPISYLQLTGELKLILVPIGSQSCSSDCYSYSNYPNFDHSISQRICPVCKKQLNPDQNYFIDIGLINLIRNYKSSIEYNKYGWVNLDSNGSIISWEEIRNPLLDSLAKYTADNIINGMLFAKYLKSINTVNYQDIRKILKSHFNKFNLDIIKYNNNKVITWCKAKIKSNDNDDFFGMILNTESNPNKFIYYGFVNQLGIEVQLSGKRTHIHYLPDYNIFLLFSVKIGIKTIYVIDLTESLLSDSNLHRLTLISVGFEQLPQKSWFCSCYDQKQNILYIYGGTSENIQQKPATDVSVLKFYVEWNGKDLKFTNKGRIQLLPKSLSLSSTVLCLLGQQKALMIGGGFQKTDKVCSIQNIIYTKLENQALCNIPGSFTGKILYYSTIIQIPKISYANNVISEPGILFFGGTPNQKTGGDRDKYKSIYHCSYNSKAERPRLQSAQKLDSECDNQNFYFLSDNSSALFKTKQNQYVIRILIPATNGYSELTESKAYLLEYDIKNKKMKEIKLKAQEIVDYD